MISRNIAAALNRDPKAQRLGISRVLLDRADWHDCGWPSSVRITCANVTRAIRVDGTAKKGRGCWRWYYCRPKERRVLWPDLEVR